jgi:sterol desaturase/sphingolipid hydroxylase (fatty acid hydroxylase superfamily)
VATDLTVAAVPGYFATMGAEHWYLKRRARKRGAPAPSDFEQRDTIASLAMGVGSLIVPMLAPKVLKPFTPGKGKYGKVLVAAAVGAAAVTTIADWYARRAEAEAAAAVDGAEAREPTAARKVAKAAGVATVVTGGVALTTWFTEITSPDRLWGKRVLPDWGSGPVQLLAAVTVWDFIYYWSHRMQHESRYMWAIHVVHHSSERYNLSTALRQPVADALGTFPPQGAVCLLGIRPELVATARGVNLLYQYWIHTDAIRKLGPFERLFNTPSHHRVHHGTNLEYLDRNHAGMFIFWDKLFGTFEPERARVRYGLTKNIDTFNPVRIAFHEWQVLLHDFRRANPWRVRLAYLFRPPGWSPDGSTLTSNQLRARAIADPEVSSPDLLAAGC